MSSSPRRANRAGRTLGLGYLIAGACFLFDPFVAVFDLLPDCLGYLFLALGLRRLADLDDRISEAARLVRRLALLGVCRLIATVLTFGLVSPTEQPTFTLLVVFTLAVLDLLMLIPMWRAFGGGLLYLGSRCDATALFDRTSRRGSGASRSITERYISFTTRYFILREALVVLPELTVLTHEKGGNDWTASSLYDSIGLFRLVGCSISLVLGIVWLCFTVSYVRRLRGDTSFLERLRTRYDDEILSRPDLLAMRAVKAALVSLCAAVFFAADFYIEGINVIPDVLSAILLGVSLVFLGRFTKDIRPAAVLTVLYGISAAITWGLQWSYLNLDRALYLKAGDSEYARLDTAFLCHAVSGLLFVASFALILRLLYRLAKTCTGFASMRDGSTQAAERTGAIHEHIRKKLIVVGIFAVLTMLSTLVQWRFIPGLGAVSLPGRPTTSESAMLLLYDFLREAYWVIDLLIGGIFFGVTLHAASEISEQMDYTELMK